MSRSLKTDRLLRLLARLLARLIRFAPFKAVPLVRPLPPVDSTPIVEYRFERLFLAALLDVERRLFFVFADERGGSERKEYFGIVPGSLSGVVGPAAAPDEGLELKADGNIIGGRGYTGGSEGMLLRGPVPTPSSGLVTAVAVGVLTL